MILTLSLSEEALSAIDSRAIQEGRTREEVIRDALQYALTAVDMADVEFSFTLTVQEVCNDNLRPEDKNDQDDAG